MARQGPEDNTLALCALAASKLFEAQQWAWAKANWCDQPVATVDDLDVADAERILQTITYLADEALKHGRSSTGRLMVEACPTVCDDCEGRCTTVWQHLGEVEL